MAPAVKVNYDDDEIMGIGGDYEASTPSGGRIYLRPALPGSAAGDRHATGLARGLFTQTRSPKSGGKLKPSLNASPRAIVSDARTKRTLPPLLAQLGETSTMTSGTATPSAMSAAAARRAEVSRTGSVGAQVPSSPAVVAISADEPVMAKLRTGVDSGATATAALEMLMVQSGNLQNANIGPQRDLPPLSGDSPKATSGTGATPTSATAAAAAAAGTAVGTPYTASVGTVEHSAIPKPGSRIGSRPVSRAGSRAGSRLGDVAERPPQFSEEASAGSAYIGLMYALRQYPDSTEFVYLRRLDLDKSSYNPYALEVVPFNAVESDDFYTMSASGLTHYKDGSNADFTTLEQWEREFQLFNALATLNVFTQFRLWKGFRVWRKGVRQAKIRRAQRLLVSNLFHLSPMFQPSLQHLRGLSFAVSQTRLNDVRRGGLYTLNEFMERQRQQHDRVLVQLKEFSVAAVDTVKGACTAVLENLEKRLDDFYGKQAEEGAQDAAGVSQQQQQQQQQQQLGSTSPMTATTSAVNTTQQQQQHQFVGGTMTSTSIMMMGNLGGTAGSFQYSNLLAAENGGGSGVGTLAHGISSSDALNGSHQHNNNSSVGGNAATTSNGTNGGAKREEESNSSSSYSYTIAAARRSEQRKLQSFVKLIDYMICDTLRDVLVESVSDMLQLTRSVRPGRRMSKNALLGPGGPNDIVDTSMFMLSKKESESMKPLFQLELLLPSEEKQGPRGGSMDGSALSFVPSGADFISSLDEVFSSGVSALSTVTRLLCHEELQSWIVEPGNEIEVNGSMEFVEDDGYQTLVADVKASISDSFKKLELFKKDYVHFGAMIRENSELDIVAMKAALLSKERSLQQFREDLDRFQEQIQQVEAIEETSDIDIVRVNELELKNILLPSPRHCLNELHDLLPKMAFEEYTTFITEVHDATARLGAPLTAVDDFVEQLNFLETLKERQRFLDEKHVEIQNMYEVIEEYHIHVPDIEYAAFQTLNPDFNAMKSIVEEVEATREDNVLRFTQDLDTRCEDISKEVVDLRNLSQHEMILDEASDAAQVISYVTDLVEKIQVQKDKARVIAEHQRLFRIPETKFEDLESTSDEITLKLNLWQGRGEWHKLTTAWNVTPFSQLDIADLDVKVTKFNKLVRKLDKGLPRNSVVPNLRRAVEDFKCLVPIVASLRNESMKERHWEKVEQIIGQALIRDHHFTLGLLIEFDVMKHEEGITQVSTEATQETALEEMLQKVVSKWASIEFNVLPYKEQKDTYILGGLDDVQTALEDSMLTMATILSSRFVAGIRGEVEKVEKQLNLFSDTLDEWLGVQKNWMYLESIFLAPDIQRQLPNEAKAFLTVDKQLRDIMRRTRDRPNALQSGTTPGYVDIFQKSNETLDKIQKNLEDYLETKRMAFPRFYFLSNDELLEILAQTKNVQAVQPHMSKCFDGIKSLDFGPDPKSIDIFSMFSREGEKVSLGKNLKARGNVENWLATVEQAMFASLKRISKQSFLDYADSNREEWLVQQPAQLVLSISQIYWCHALEMCFAAEDDVRGAMQLELDNEVAQLAVLSKVVRGELPKLVRKIIATLITIDVHNRDITEQLRDKGVRDVNDFDWQMQLRFYWEEDEIIVKQTNARFLYGYEYLGAQPRLVVTPMTDRCYMTLSGALHLKLGGAPQGPAGTGKTETTKDLSKALGVQCVVFNCGDNLDYKFMGKFFSGLSQCGAWACFDEFNRIDIEVLSVVAQQLLTIQNALRAAVPKFLFEDRNIKLVPTFGCFITMNPGYAGRTELPDNLASLFRPMAMMIPDYGLVAEVMLFSEGFESSKTLSRKMVKLYKLSSEQLSQQDHYDFGMRALKSVLVMAGSLKRANADLNEDIVLIRAMRDSNLPKFLSEDAVLFEAIVADLFPGCEVPNQDYGALATAIEESIASRNLQRKDCFVNKVVQLFETLNVRFGVMAVGPTGGGKTKIYQTLQDAMTRLRKAGDTDERFQVTHSYVLNPKCIKMGELYGEYNLLTNEWTDGLASTLIRNAVADQSQDRKWVVFDGPVDAIWIENMNTVLDDNCTLCLPNGERIKLNSVTMRTLFEVQDLAVASPATVSRCGMVYVPSEELGWRPLATTFFETEVGGDLRRETVEYILGLYTKYVDSALNFIRTSCRELIPSVDINLVASMNHLVKSLLVRVGASMSLATSSSDELHPIVNKLFIFALMWSIGGNLDEEGMLKMDEYIRDSMNDICSFPPAGLIYDYFVDTKENVWSPWHDTVPAFVYDKRTPYFQMLVQTVDTVRFSHVLELNIDVGRSVLFGGVSGVGKSVIMQDALHRLSEPLNLLPVTVNFSAQTKAFDTQIFIESKLEKKRKTKFGPPVGKRMVIFVDDVNMPAKEKYGAQPPIELLRQFQDFRGFYDRYKLNWKDIENVILCAACAPAGGGRNDVSPRFLRHFSMLNVPAPSEASMKTILSAILGGYLKDFPADFSRSILGPVVASSIELYQRMCSEMLPTPTRSHYTFNLRDLSKVIQGLLGITPSVCPDTDTMLRLWVHESLRVFHDRLISNDDKKHVKTMLVEIINKNGFVASYADLFEERSILFVDFLRRGAERDERRYEEVEDVAKLVNVLEEYLDEYNTEGTNQMNLVFFMDAVEHVCRIARILTQPRGNAMLVGVGGSGKQSLTRFAAYISEYRLFQIELTRGYGSTEFREDLKAMYKVAGVDGEPLTFLFTDTQIVEESFLEDINNILNSGEVPGLFAQDEKDRFINDMRPVVQQLGLAETKDNLYNTFINRVRDNFHIVLCMSPVGDAFRSRCRQFPSLINCSTIDWFVEWPETALLSVSERFLAGMKLSDEATREALSKMCVQIHTSVSTMSDLFYEQLRRKFYTTPKSYLDLINLYVALLEEKRSEYSTNRDRLLNGLSKLEETNAVVDTMKDELGKLQPILEEKTAATAVLMEQVARDEADAKQVAAVVAAEEAEVKAQADATQSIADDAKADLAEALPALHAAVDSLKSLNKGDITEIKSFPKPPPLVQKTMEAVCILLQQKPDWDNAKKILGDTNFLRTLMDFDKDNIDPKVIKQLGKYIEDPEYLPEIVARQSKAAQSLCMWTRAMDVYDRVAKQVQPKKEKLAAAEAELEKANANLKGKQDSLREVQDKVAELQARLAEAKRESQSLTDQAETTSKRLSRARKLTSALADEQVRWKETADLIEHQMQLLVGDVFLSAACVAYYGAFTGTFRSELVSGWIDRCKELDIPVSDDCSLRATLSNPVEVREWNIWGLPSDDVSIDNGILVTRGRRWPLCIDPQGQANSWIKAMEAKNGLRVIKLSDGNFLRTLENSIRIGNPVLLEDMGEAIDPALEPVLLKQIFKQNGRQLIRIGDSDVDYDPNFKFYMTTKMSNPHYMPEVCIKVTVINFTVTLRGLEDQLLGDVVRKERPDLEEMKDRLVVSISNDKKQLKELEDKILKLLKESEGNILDDEVLINTLNNSKLTSGMIQGRVKEAEQTEKSINEARENYRPAATRGSIIYFVIADLANISPMYQYSLTYFTRLFNSCIDDSTKSDEVQIRINLLCEHTTEFMYKNVCRGLFEAHKLLFSFLLCSAIQRDSGELTEPDWNFMLRGAATSSVSAAIADGLDNPDIDFYSESTWACIAMLSAGGNSAFSGLMQSMVADITQWKMWSRSTEPHIDALPGEWESKLSAFQKMMLVKLFREEKVLFAVQRYVELELGKRFTEPSPWTLDDVFPDTNARTPVIFVLSTGADPTAQLQRFAEKKGWTARERLHMISLGQGQGKIAETLLAAAMKSGDWICLQNCHLARSWMPQLETIVANLSSSSSTVHEDFRLWLTSMPADSFPVLVLQNGIKLTNEPPKGVRANVNRTYNDLTEATFESCSKPGPWRALLFSLSFFHAVIQERRKYGPLGWNKSYGFNNSDFECSMQTLRMFLDEQEEIPWQALAYVVGQINYGGRVTDDLDRRCLMCILDQYMRPDVLDIGYAFSPSGTYVTPAAETLGGFRDYVKSLPAAEEPEVFGMHDNANITFQMQESKKIMDVVLSIQPRVSSTTGGTTPDEIVTDLVAALEAQLPSSLSLSQAKEGLFSQDVRGQVPSLSIVLKQEVDRFNRLLHVMRKSLSALSRAIRGLVVMSGELELMYNSLLNSAVPKMWSDAAFPSLKPLASWMKDLVARIDFMRSWLEQGNPATFWLPGFFFPQGFMTGALQTHARRYQVAIDTLTYGFEMREMYSATAEIEPPQDGVLIRGLHLDGARWNQEKRVLDLSKPGVMHDELPVVHFVPREAYEPPEDEYQCPLYKTSVRAGVLSTTGQSTNFVLNISLPIVEGTRPKDWVLQGVAALCMLDD